MFEQLSRKSKSATQRRLADQGASKNPPVQRYVYYGKNNRYRIYSWELIPPPMRQRIEAIKDPELRNALERLLKQAITDYTIPVRFFEDLTDEELAVIVSELPVGKDFLRQLTPRTVFLGALVDYHSYMSMVPFDWGNRLLVSIEKETLRPENVDEVFFLLDHIDVGSAVKKYRETRDGPLTRSSKETLRYLYQQTVPGRIHESERSDMDVDFPVERVRYFRYGNEVPPPWEEEPMLWESYREYTYLDPAEKRDVSGLDVDRRPSASFGGTLMSMFRSFVVRRRSSASTQGLELEVPESALFNTRVHTRAFTCGEFQERLKEEHPEKYDIRHQIEPLLIFLEQALEKYALLREVFIQSLGTSGRRLRNLPENMSSEDRKFDQTQKIHFLFEALDEMEHRIYEWHRSAPFTYIEHMPPFGKSIFLLLHTLGMEHQFLTLHALQSKLPAWVFELDKLSGEGQKLVGLLWENIVSKRKSPLISQEDGRERFPGQSCYPFPVYIASQLLRIMSRPFGRSFLKKLFIDHQSKVNIFPWWNKQFLKTGAHFKTIGLTRPVELSTGTKEDFPAFTPSTVRNGGAVCLDYPQNDLAFSSSSKEGQEISYVQPLYSIRKGKDKVLSTPFYPENAVDFDEQLDVGCPVFWGMSGFSTLSPIFIIFAHELGHVLNNQMGTKRTMIEKKRYLTQPQYHVFGDNEEHYVIEKVENALRNEHGLPERGWHLQRINRVEDFW